MRSTFENTFPTFENTKKKENAFSGQEILQNTALPKIGLWSHLIHYLTSNSDSSHIFTPEIIFFSKKV